MHVERGSGWKTCGASVVGYSRSRKVGSLLFFYSTSLGHMYQWLLLLLTLILGVFSPLGTDCDLCKVISTRRKCDITNTASSVLR